MDHKQAEATQSDREPTLYTVYYPPSVCMDKDVNWHYLKGLAASGYKVTVRHTNGKTTVLEG